MADDLGFDFTLKTPSEPTVPTADELRPRPREGLAARLDEISRLRQRDADTDRTAVFILGIGAVFCLLMLLILALAQPRGGEIRLSEQLLSETPLQSPPADIWTPAADIEFASLADLPPALRETVASLDAASRATLGSDLIGAASSLATLALDRSVSVAPGTFFSPVSSILSRVSSSLEPRLAPTDMASTVRPAFRAPRSAPSTKPVQPSAAVSEASPLAASSAGQAAGTGRVSGVRTLPPRLPGRSTDRASAGRALVDLVGQAGEIMPEAAQVELGMRVLRALETSPVGGRTDFATPEGRRGKLYATDLRAETSQRLVRRDARIAKLPSTLRIDTGWMVAREDTGLRPAMSAGTEAARVRLAPGIPMERLATLSDAYGARWYLVGSGGIGVGYVPADEVMPAELYQGTLGDPLAISVDDAIVDAVTATTVCRGLYVQLDGIEAQGSSFCREASGDWRAEGYGAPAVMPVARNAALWSGDGPVRLEQAAMLAIQSDAPGGDDGRGPELARELNRLLSEAPANEVQSIELAGGTVVTVTLDTPRDAMRSMTIARNAEVMPLPSGMRFEAGWLEALDPVVVRSVPADMPGSALTEIQSGRFVARLAMYESAAGGSWYLVGEDGIGVGFVPMTSMALADTAIPGKRADLTLTRVVRDQVRAGVPCRDMVMRVAGTTRQFSGCRAADGGWVLERDLGGWLDVLPMAVQAK